MGDPWGSWLVPLAILAACAVMLVAAGSSFVDAEVGLIRERLFCPIRRASVTVAFLWQPFQRRYLDVESCSAFEELEAVTCDRHCLRLAGPRSP